MKGTNRAVEALVVLYIDVSLEQIIYARPIVPFTMPFRAF
jgi:hypothetical protein